jgi:hypothetical protein
LPSSSLSVVGDQFEVGTVHVAAPDGAFLAIGFVGGPLLPLAVRRLQAADARIAHREVELPVRADVDAMHAVVVVEAAKARQELLRRPIGFEVAILVLEKEDVGRLTDKHLLPLPIRGRRNANAQRRDDLGRLVEGLGLIRLAVRVGVNQHNDAVPLLADDRPAERLAPVVHRFAHPDVALVIDVDRGGVDQQGLGGEELDLKPVRNLECPKGLIRREWPALLGK